MILPTLSSLDGYSFGLDVFNKRLRFSIYRDGEELACRKEEFNVFISLFQSRGEGIFQGKIKLRTDEKHVAIFLKGQCVGTMGKQMVNKAIQNLLDEVKVNQTIK